MSLLLDALQRASKEKEKLADARAAAAEASTASPPPLAPFPTLAIDAPVESVPKVDGVSPVELTIEPTTGTSAPLQNSVALDGISASPKSAADFAAASPTQDLSVNQVDAPGEWVLDPVEGQAASSSSAGAGSARASTAPDHASAAVAMQSDTASAQYNEKYAKPAATRMEPSASSRPSAPAHPSPGVSPQIAREILGATAKPAKRGPSRRLIAMGVIALLIAAANAAFFLGFLDRFLGASSSGLTPAVAPPPVVAAAPAPIAAPVAAEGQASAGSAGSPEAKAESPVPASASAAARVAGATPRAAARRAEGSVPDEGKSAVSASPTAARSESRISSAKSRPVFVARPGALSALDTAYAALTEDRLDEARIAYRKALEKNPGERDALLGLAYIAQRQGDNEEARVHYQNVLRQEPGNAGANAGLLAIAADGDLPGAASRARDMAERSPDSAAMLSTLGGILAKEGRIGEAQQAYFKALTLEPDNALHAYNLAVALDRLHKYAQARSYYQRALALAEKSSAGDRANFPRQEALQRLEQLSATSSGAQLGYLPESRAR